MMTRYKDGDPYAKDYFIEYYENGDFHSLNYTTSPVSFTYQGGYPSTNTFCNRSSSKQCFYYIPCAGSGECDKFSLSFSREGWDKIPKVGEYAFSLPTGGNASLQIDGASNCIFTDKPDTYVKLSITEVKVVKDYGPAKAMQSQKLVRIYGDILVENSKQYCMINHLRKRLWDYTEKASSLKAVQTTNGRTKCKTQWHRNSYQS